MTEFTEQESKAIYEAAVAPLFQELQSAGFSDEAQAAYSKANAALWAEHEARLNGEAPVTSVDAEEVTSVALTALRERCVQEGAGLDEVADLGLEDLIELLIELVTTPDETAEGAADAGKQPEPPATEAPAKKPAASK